MTFDRIDQLLNAALNSGSQNGTTNSDRQALVTQPGFAIPTTSAASLRPINRLSRRRRSVALNSIPVAPPVVPPTQRVHTESSQTVDFYTESLLRAGGDTVTWRTVLADTPDASNDAHGLFVPNNTESISSEDPGESADVNVNRTAPGEPSVIIEQPLPSNQEHFTQELLLELREHTRGVQEQLNFHSEITRKIYGCVEPLLTNSLEQVAVNRLLINRMEFLQGALQTVIQNHEAENSQRQLMVRLLSNLTRAILPHCTS
ncbi:uncharacterized protein LOC130549926 [Triplophysa rosa]|uniref:uncharacterized protein LOC130549926 n=1 Tax=Triplophysa rosa TaxID=992332 RepID=UPI002545FD18|nr:uncharacterized protein LOC130549926 [Triplophysa rosa]